MRAALPAYFFRCGANCPYPEFLLMEEIFMEVIVLQKACIQCGLCAGLCPEVFALNSGEPARVTVDPIPDAQKIGVQEAADSCPVAAIQVTA